MEEGCWLGEERRKKKWKKRWGKQEWKKECKRFGERRRINGEEKECWWGKEWRGEQKRGGEKRIGTVKKHEERMDGEKRERGADKKKKKITLGVFQSFHIIIFSSTWSQRRCHSFLCFGFVHSLIGVFFWRFLSLPFCWLPSLWLLLFLPPLPTTRCYHFSRAGYYLVLIRSRVPVCGGLFTTFYLLSFVLSDSLAGLKLSHVHVIC